MKKNIMIIIVVVLLLLASFPAYYFINKIHTKLNNQRQQIEYKKLLVRQKEEKRLEILSHYNKTVETNDKIKIYTLNENEYVESGSIEKGILIELNEIEITDTTEYFPISIDNYYVYYKDVNKSTKEIEKNDRYKNYIPYNENIITNNTTEFYDENGSLVYTFSKSFDLPILIKKWKYYGVEFNNTLLYIKNDSIKNTKYSNNTTKQNVKKIAVLNYHFFYDDTKESEREACKQNLCNPTSKLKQHLEYIKNNNIFTPTLAEFEMWLDKKIQLPKSVVLTVDDGWRREKGIELMEQYHVNGTVFLITGNYEKVSFLNDYKYIEFHSHSENLHTQGQCKGYNGGGITCLNRNYLLADLAKSRSKLNNTTYFCYPFFEYNNYAISILKEAGFTMAFGGGSRSAYIGVDKYKIPRYVIEQKTTASDIANYINN